MDIKKIINEAYQDILQIKKISEDVIKYYTELNIGVLYDLYKNQYKFNDLENEIILEYEQVLLKDITKSSNYPSLQNLIENMGLIVIFDDKFVGKNNAQYETNEKYKILRINVRTEDFYNVLKNHEIDIKNLNDASITTINKILYNILYESFGGEVSHELQHAFDDFRTNSKFTRNKKSQDFFKKMHSKDNRHEISDEEYIKYLNLPHELWGRFSETISLFNDDEWNDDFLNILKKFRKKFRGYTFLNEKDKKRLIKELYKLYDFKKVEQ